MKKIICVLLAVLLMLFLLSCADDMTDDDGAFLSELLSKVESQQNMPDAEPADTEYITETKESEIIPFSAVTEENEENKDNNVVRTTDAVSDDTEIQTQTVYITPTGECYHYDPDCGGKNSQKADFSDVKDSHRPCKKCAEGKKAGF